MRTYSNPDRTEWLRLSQRPVVKNADLREKVGIILNEVRTRRDDALREFALDEALEFSNVYAPEHLILSVAKPEIYIPAIRNAGSVFLGYLGAEALGDYASGTNHVLPTNGTARALSGVSVDTFVKKVTFQRVTSEGLTRLAPIVARMAQAEGLDAHARAVLIREEVVNG